MTGRKRLGRKHLERAAPCHLDVFVSLPFAEQPATRWRCWLTLDRVRAACARKARRRCFFLPLLFAGRPGFRTRSGKRSPLCSARLGSVERSRQGKEGAIGEPLGGLSASSPAWRDLRWAGGDRLPGAWRGKSAGTESAGLDSGHVCAARMGISSGNESECGSG